MFKSLFNDNCHLRIARVPVTFPANTGHLPNAVSMLAHRLRRWTNIETALGECLVFAGLAPFEFRVYLLHVSPLHPLLHNPGQNPDALSHVVPGAQLPQSFTHEGPYFPSGHSAKNIHSRLDTIILMICAREPATGNP